MHQLLALRIPPLGPWLFCPTSPPKAFLRKLRARQHAEFGGHVSTPLKPHRDQFNQACKYEEPLRSLNLSDFEGCHYNLWASTPAIIWTADRPQEKGIHVHDGKKRIVDDTFSDVMFQSKHLSRTDLLQEMISRTIT
jgi:hypothetical protein